MHFTTVCVSALAAVLALASPIAHVERDLCDVGVPCWISGLVQTNVDMANSVYADVSASLGPDQTYLNVPVTDICTGINNAASVVASFVASEKASISALVAVAESEVASVEAQIIAAIQPTLDAALGLVATAEATVNDQAGLIATAKAGLMVSLDDLSAIIGRCY